MKSNKNLEELNLPVLYKEKKEPTLEELTRTIKSSYNRFNGKNIKNTILVKITKTNKFIEFILKLFFLFFFCFFFSILKKQNILNFEKTKPNPGKKLNHKFLKK